MTIKQKQLNLKHFRCYYLGAIDGVWGSKSKQATKEFQADYGLVVDGIFGSNTENKNILVIKDFQERLNRVNATKIVADGLIGNKTIESIKEYQRNNGLVADGLCGSKTYAKLYNEPTPKELKLMFPVNYIAITQPFKKGVHNGVDLGWNSKYGGNNQDILAPEDGTVIAVKNDCNQTYATGGSYGNYVKIDHGNGICTLSAHLKYQSVTVKVGDRVTRGQKIANMGNTGHSKGNHDHYEVFVNGTKTNPLDRTWVYPNQIVSSDTKSKYNLNYV